MTYYGSIALLVAYALYLCFVPPLLRGKRDLNQFTTDLIAAQGVPAPVMICNAIADYLEPLGTIQLTSATEIGRLNIVQATPLLNTLLVNVRGSAVRQANSGELGAPTGLGSLAIRFYFNWKNDARPLARYIVFGLASIGFLLLFIPAVDLFLRVVDSTFRQLVGA
jgi:hypothetical protein